MSERPSPLFNGPDYTKPKHLLGKSCPPEQDRKNSENQLEQIKQAGLGTTGAIVGITLGLVFWGGTDIYNYSSAKKTQQTTLVTNQGAKDTRPVTSHDPRP